MTFLPRVGLSVALLSALLGVLVWWAPHAPEATATVAGLFQDSDGDLIADSLEAVLMTDPVNPDSDGDGVGDFLEAVQHQPPIPTQNTPAAPMDDEMRAVVTVEELANTPQVVLHLMFRVVDGQLSRVQALQVFLDTQGVRVPLNQVAGDGILNITVQHDPIEGALVVLSSRISSLSDMRGLLPCSLGATGVIGQRSFETGVVLVEVSGSVAAIMAMTKDRFVIQPIQGKQDPTQPFWRSAHVCELDLAPMGSSGNSVVTQVVEAACTGVPTLRCAPSCDSWAGKVFVVPYGLGFLSGE